MTKKITVGCKRLPADGRARAVTSEVTGVPSVVTPWSALAAEYTDQNKPLLASLAYGCAKFPCPADNARDRADEAGRGVSRRGAHVRNPVRAPGVDPAVPKQHRRPAGASLYGRGQLRHVPGADDQRRGTVRASPPPVRTSTGSSVSANPRIDRRRDRCGVAVQAARCVRGPQIASATASVLTGSPARTQVSRT